MAHIIQTNRLLLRQYAPEDWQRVHLYASIPEFSQFDVWGPNNVDDTKNFVQECIARTTERPILRYELAIVLRKRGLLIGGCGLKRQNVAATYGNLGFAVNPDYQNNGYATEAAVALIDFAFNKLGLVQVYAECDTRNEASRRVMERAGMREASVLCCDREVKGVMTDSYRYVIDQRNEST